ncbi:UPF0280 family protein [Candidatus Bathyarchaeota archaeon]|nr:UPF0280 family protein [Candidatus Bathyarchaeota archaeon]
MTNRAIKIVKNIGQSRILVETNSHDALNAAFNSVILNRLRLENYIEKHPAFLWALEPVEVGIDAPEVVRRMAAAALGAGVGPMAAVAGAIADLALEAMAPYKASIAIVENGGEISVLSRHSVTIGILAPPPISRSIGFLLHPWEMPLGIGTSSASLGGGFTFGEADLVTIFADDAALADAAATAVCNEVRGPFSDGFLQRILSYALSMKGVRGALIIWNGRIGTAGSLPRIVKLQETKESAVETSLIFVEPSS